jgi:GDPmannose 4,6-dehydratase
MKTALIFGVTGQDGSYLSEILLQKGYQVHGVIRKSATGNLRNIQHLIDQNRDSFILHRGDLADTSSISRIISAVLPDEIYNEADQDHVRWSYDLSEYAIDITAGGVVRILESIRLFSPKSKFFQPCSSNMFGITDSLTQNESTQFNPQSPYAIAKTTAYYTTKFYRETHGLFATTAILYNHESPRRTDDYVSRKITSSIAKILSGKLDYLYLGDISAIIDWGYAKDYMNAAWNIMQLSKPQDFIIGSGKAHSVEDFVKIAFSLVNLNYEHYLKINENLIRPSKTTTLIGDISKAEKMFNFKNEYSLDSLIKLMLSNDLIENGLDPKDYFND